MEATPLVLDGPYSLCGSNGKGLAFSKKAPATRGVYIWAVDRLGDLWISYVGVSDDMRLRQKEHVQNYLAGKYWIYGQDYLQAIKPPLAYDPDKQDWPEFWANSASNILMIRALAEYCQRFTSPGPPSLVTLVEDAP